MSLKTVVIVEPNPGILIVGRNVLARAGFVVSAVGTVEEGLAEARRRPPDVVLLDGRWSEPEVLLAFTRSKPRGVPIVLTVQKGRDVITIEALEAGGWSNVVEVADVIEKPFSPERLLHAVEKALIRAAERTDPRFVLGADLPTLGDDPDETERTDKFEKTNPFEALLDSVSERAPTRRPSATKEITPIIAHEPLQVSPRYAGLRARLEAALTEQNVRLDPRQVLALADACEAALRGEEARVRGDRPRGDLAMEGRLEHLPIDQILQIASSVAAPSCCRLEHDAQAVEIYFRGPNVVFARQDNMPEGFMLGRFLAASGVVDQLDVDRTVSARSGLEGWIGQRLLSLGYIGERDLRTALERQIEELVFEAVRWTAGRFMVYARDPLPPQGEDASVSLPIHHLLLEGMRRLDEWRRMVRDVGDLRAVIDRLDLGDAASVLESLKPEERTLLEHVDGRRTVEDLLRSVRRPTFDVFKALERLRGRRLVTVVEPIASA